MQDAVPILQPNRNKGGSKCDFIKAIEQAVPISLARCQALRLDRKTKQARMWNVILLILVAWVVFEIPKYLLSERDKKKALTMHYHWWHCILAARWNKHTEIGFTVVHSQIHWRRRFCLHILVQIARWDQQTWWVAGVAISISCFSKN